MQAEKSERSDTQRFKAALWLRRVRLVVTCATIAIAITIATASGYAAIAYDDYYSHTMYY